MSSIKYPRDYLNSTLLRIVFKNIFRYIRTDPSMKRNIYYYVYPLKGSIWEWNLEQLAPYLGHFNGRKLIRIAIDEKTESAEAVEKKLPGTGWTVLVGDNDHNFGEQKFFIQDFSSLESHDASEITFRAHAKGVTRTGDMLKNVMAWTKAMYWLNLKNVGLIDKLIAKYSAVGAFQIDIPDHHRHSLWHYSGSFFWLRHSTIFSRLWRDIEKDFWGVEHYVGRHIALSDAFNFTPGKGSNYFNEVTQEECASWMYQAMRSC
jgi:hypothetical protein